jgi:hypothetical protein
MSTEQKVVERKISSEIGMMENGGGRTRKTSANGLPKPATHPEKPAILTTTNDLSQYHQTAPVNVNKRGKNLGIMKNISSNSNRLKIQF